mgnify:CR=1 FL=1
MTSLTTHRWGYFFLYYFIPPSLDLRVILDYYYNISEQKETSDYLLITNKLKQTKWKDKNQNREHKLSDNHQ